MVTSFSRPRSGRAEYVIAGLILACLLGLLSTPSAPGSAVDQAPAGNRVDDLTLRLGGLGWFRMDLRCPAGLVLVNHADRLRTLTELPTVGNELRRSPKLTFIVRFKNGEVYEADGMGVPDAAEDRPQSRLRPLAVPADGEIWCDLDIREHIFAHNPALREAFSRCKEFCLTALVEPLNLKSNTVCFNGFRDLPKDYDPFRDAETYRRLRKAKGP